MNGKTMTAAEIAALVQGELKGSPDRTVSGVHELHAATPEQASFVSHAKYRAQLAETLAGVVLVCPDLANESTEKHTLIVCQNADYAFTLLAGVFAVPPPFEAPGIHPSAVVDPSVKLGRNVFVGANAVIEKGAEIGDGAYIGAGCYVGHDVTIGEGTRLAPNVTVMYRCKIGRQCILHPGVVIGADGFGFVPGPKGLVKVPQTGYVQIDDDVEIGANTTVDRARFDKTWIKSNVKIDDQVMVAHNVTVGESSILVAQCGIAGSSTIGRGVILAAKVGINGHITLGDGVQVAGTSSVKDSLPDGAIALGTPAESQREYMARWTLPSRFAKLKEQVKKLQEAVDALQK